LHTLRALPERIMDEIILVINAGSSSIKFAFYPANHTLNNGPLLRGKLEDAEDSSRLIISRSGRVPEIIAVKVAPNAPEQRMDFLVAWLRNALNDYRVTGIGHRIVHGGEHHALPVFIDGKVIASLEALLPLARLHGPHEVAAIKALAASMPDVRQVACFDTAFHHHRPMLDQMFAIPREFFAAGVRRYGFHGLSYEFIASRLPDLLNKHAEGRVVVAHLGSGASMCAMFGRRSIATTMGFTALDGLMMGTRCGAIDPGVLLYAIQERGLTAHEVSDILYNESGLLGVSALSSDMRKLEASADPNAKQAIALYVYRAVRELGALVAVLGGLDALVFTGGIGEHSHEVRAMICDKLSWLGVELDAQANRRHATVIGTIAERAAVFAVATDEELIIARHTRRLLDAQGEAA
jgi:acetate kinase